MKSSDHNFHTKQTVTKANSDAVCAFMPGGSCAWGLPAGIPACNYAGLKLCLSPEDSETTDPELLSTVLSSTL